MGPFSFRYEGKVRGKGRPRFSSGRVYAARPDVDYESCVRKAYTDAGGPFFEGPVSVSIDVFRKLPSSRPKRVVCEQDVSKPDVDNIAKAVLDALNGVAWEDDAQVVCVEVRKHPRMRLEEHMCVTVRGA